MLPKRNALLDAAGLKRGADGTRLDQDGKPMRYELIVSLRMTDWISAAQIVSQNMKRHRHCDRRANAGGEHLDRHGGKGPVPMVVRVRFRRPHPL